MIVLQSRNRKMASMLVDHVLGFGPKAGMHGGEVIAQGSPLAVGKQRSSATGPYLSGRKSIPIPKNRRMTKELAQQCPTRKTER